MLLDMARAVGPAGRIICADIQPAMLDRVTRKAERAGFADRVRVHHSQPRQIGLDACSVDFALAFWMLHETPDPADFLEQIAACLRPGGRLLLVEPRFHVGAVEFERLLGLAKACGLRMVEQPNILMSRAVLFELASSVSRPCAAGD
jgi:ubiquinone/menaquinone biosynthesis C-methylase UbiE